MKKICFVAGIAAITLSVASCGGNASTASGGGQDSVQMAVPVNEIDTAALRAEAEPSIRQTVTSLYDSQKKETALTKLDAKYFTPEFIKAFSEPKAALEAESKKEMPKKGGLMPGVNTVPYDLLYGSNDEPAPDGTEWSEHGKYVISDIQFDENGNAVVTVMATIKRTIFNFEEDRETVDYRKATVTLILSPVDGKWLIDDIRFKDTGSFRQAIENGKAFNTEWYS